MMRRTAKNMTLRCKIKDDYGCECGHCSSHVAAIDMWIGRYNQYKLYVGQVNSNCSISGNERNIKFTDTMKRTLMEKISEMSLYNRATTRNKSSCTYLEEVIPQNHLTLQMSSQLNRSLHRRM